MDILLIIAIVFAIIEWFAELRWIRWMIYFFKPAVMIVIISWITLQVDFNNLVGNEVMFPIVWFLVGMIFGLAGDIFLMTGEQFFIPGLVSFLIGHVFYIIGLGQIIPKIDYLIPGLIVFILVLLVSSRIYYRISRGLISSSKEKLKIPVLVYSVVISVMLYAALLTLFEREWNYQAALPMAFGALFFYVSDVLNAWIRFVQPLKIGRVMVMVTYHLGQLAIAVGSVLHYLYRIDT
jgi:uncharacterized membrane protein YhhN